MDLFGYGNKIEIENMGNGFAKVSMDGKSVYVKCMVISDNSVNYEDILKVKESCQNLINEVQRKLYFDELEEHLIKDFGEINVR